MKNFFFFFHLHFHFHFNFRIHSCQREAQNLYAVTRCRAVLRQLISRFLESLKIPTAERRNFTKLEEAILRRILSNLIRATGEFESISIRRQRSWEHTLEYIMTRRRTSCVLMISYSVVVCLLKILSPEIQVYPQT